jgi:glucosamine 6-phosphate synthetase-like amidotransferase/phosphosugar isomerase protein
MAGRYRHLLPAPAERVAVIGCGTSLYIARAYAYLRESLGLGLTDAWPASEARLGRGYDRLIAITRSGTTTEVLDTLGWFRGRAPVTAITAPAGTPVYQLADVIGLPEFDEQSVVQTRFATSALALLRAHLGEDLSPAIAQARTVLAAPVAELDDVRRSGQVTFVGMGLGAALAEEAALKLRESTQAWAEAYYATEYRHGPVSIAEKGRAVWALGPLVPGFADDVAATGAHLEHTGNDPMAELVRVHLLCLLRAGDLGMDPAHPRHLDRSVILDGDTQRRLLRGQLGPVADPFALVPESGPQGGERPGQLGARQCLLQGFVLAQLDPVRLRQLGRERARVRAEKHLEQPDVAHLGQLVAGFGAQPRR